jgi:hypothetical protein
MVQMYTDIEYGQFWKIIFSESYHVDWIINSFRFSTPCKTHRNFVSNFRNPTSKSFFQVMFTVCKKLIFSCNLPIAFNKISAP